MKKLMMFALICIGTGLFAQQAVPQPAQPRQPKEAPQPPAPVTVTGTLAYDSGRIVLKSGNDVYYVGNLGRIIGFVDGVKENATVSLEGYDRVLNEAAKHFFMATKLTIAGRSYDLPAPRAGFAQPGSPEKKLGFARQHDRMRQHDRRREFDRDDGPKGRGGPDDRGGPGASGGPRERGNGPDNQPGFKQRGERALQDDKK